ncbi:hypothetical protein HYU95_05625 [Candidatus Daviesbacteria bacterium]|nr:hypothetical protein [Candidatus Daviesbacteria bacterium]
MKELIKPLGNIIRRSSEVPLDVWNCVVPRKTPFSPIAISQGFLDGAAIASIISITRNGDVALAVILTGAVSYLHYLDRRMSGNWR